MSFNYINSNILITFKLLMKFSLKIFIILFVIKYIKA